MFYLKNFLNTIKKNPIRGSIFVIMSFLFIISFGTKNKIDKVIERKLQVKSSSNDFFHALVPTKYNHNKIARKIRNLPGVSKVNVLDEGIVKKEVDKVLSELPKEISSELELEYVGLKIIYVGEITTRSQELIRSYLKRLVGSEVSVGQIFRAEKTSSANKSLRAWGSKLVFIVISIVWFISFMVFNKKVLEVSYIIESFQRRSLVGLKTMLSGVGLFVVLSFGVLPFIAKSVFIWAALASVLFIMLALVFCRKVSWH